MLHTTNVSITKYYIDSLPISGCLVCSLWIIKTADSDAPPPYLPPSLSPSLHSSPCSSHLSHHVGLGLEEEVPDYDLDSEDEEWLSAQTKERVSLTPPPSLSLSLSLSQQVYENRVPSCHLPHSFSLSSAAFSPAF